MESGVRWACLAAAWPTFWPVLFGLYYVIICQRTPEKFIQVCGMVGVGMGGEGAHGGQGVERRGSMQQPDAAISVILTLSLHVPLASQDNVAPVGNSHRRSPLSACESLFLLPFAAPSPHPHLTGQCGTCRRQSPGHHHHCCPLSACNHLLLLPFAAPSPHRTMWRPVGDTRMGITAAAVLLLLVIALPYCV